MPSTQGKEVLLLAVVMIATFACGFGVLNGGSDILDLPVGTASAQQGSGDAALVVTNATVVSENQVAGEPFRVRVQVQNLEGATAPVSVSEVSVTSREETVFSDGIGTLPPGTSTTLVIPVKIDSPGNYNLDVEARGTTIGTGTVINARRPLPVEVRQNQSPQINVVSEQLSVERQSDINITVSNGNQRQISNLRLQVESELIQFDNPQRLQGSLEPGETGKFEFVTTPRTSGVANITVTLSYDDRTGQTQQESVYRTVEVADQRQVLSTALSPRKVGLSGETTVSLTLANQLEEPLNGVRLQLNSPRLNIIDKQRVQSTLAASDEAAFNFTLSGVEEGQYEFTVTGQFTTSAGTQRRFSRQLETTIERVANPGQVNLTGIRFSATPSGLSVRGSASNTGATNVSGVTIAVKDSDSVVPAQSQSSFFAGDIAAGEFTSFDITATPRTNGTARIPLEISYVVDGVEVTRTKIVSYQVPSRTSPPSSRGGGGPPLLAIGGIVAIAAVAAVVWRFKRS
jgi:hypothetical protein